jgi:hypothetical protein
VAGLLKELHLEVWRPKGHLLNIVLELPPAPAARVLLGLWFAVFSARSAAAFRRITVAGPPGGLGDACRAVVEPEAALLTGDWGRGEDCDGKVSYGRELSSECCSGKSSDWKQQHAK